MDENYEQIAYWNGEDHPGTEGWYIVYLDGDGEQYDAIGPYDTQEEAERIQQLTEAV